jgi:hypothetical protein
MGKHAGPAEDPDSVDGGGELAAAFDALHAESAQRSLDKAPEEGPRHPEPKKPE